MVKINWTRQAVEDMLEIRNYYIGLSYRYASELTDQLFAEVEVLKSYPAAGNMVPEMVRHDIKEIVFKNYRIIFRIVSNERYDILAIHRNIRSAAERFVEPNKDAKRI